MEVLLTIALPTVTHLFIGHFLEPKLMGDSLELHPITVLLCLIFWGMIWGVPGMLLAAPMTATAKLVFESMEVTLPIAQLLSGSLADTLDESDVEGGGGGSARSDGGDGGRDGGREGKEGAGGPSGVLIGPGGDDCGGPALKAGLGIGTLGGQGGVTSPRVSGQGGGLLGAVLGAGRRDKSAHD
jgi:hypothetical protein